MAKDGESFNEALLLLQKTCVKQELGKQVIRRLFLLALTVRQFRNETMKPQEESSKQPPAIRQEKLAAKKIEEFFGRIDWLEKRYPRKAYPAFWSAFCGAVAGRVGRGEP